MCLIVRLSTATVTKVMSAYTDHGKIISAKRNSGRKSTLTGRNHRTSGRIVSNSHTTTAAKETGQQN
jgi:hypothetical protein